MLGITVYNLATNLKTRNQNQLHLPQRILREMTRNILYIYLMDLMLERVKSVLDLLDDGLPVGWSNEAAP